MLFRGAFKTLLVAICGTISGDHILLLDGIPTIYMAYAAVFAGIAGLIWSADRFVAGAGAFALNFGISPMIIGLTIVSFGTSAPEVLVSLSASFSGAGDIAVGNALGSNVANIGLVLAVTALIARIPVQKHILKDELPILVLITVLAGIFLFDAKLSRVEGWILLLSLIPAMAFIVWRKKTSISDKEKEEEEDIQSMGNGPAIAWFFIGLGLLIGSSKILVWGAQTTAEHFEVSPLIIGLTVLAIGTSLPELAASVASALKGMHEIALGNVIGSNLFNLLAVMSLPGIINPSSYDAEVFSRDYLTMAAFTFGVSLLILVALRFRGENAYIGRISGSILLLSYLAYILVLFRATAS